jgi:hypothetical protein
MLFPQSVPKVFHRFKQAKFASGGSILMLMPIFAAVQMTLTAKLVLSKYVRWPSQGK